MYVDFNWLEAMRTSPILMFLMGCSVVMVAVALERLLYFRKRNGDASAVTMQVLEKLRKGQFKEALWACQSSSHPMGAVAHTTLSNAKLRAEEIEEKLQIALSEQKMLLEKNLGALGSMAAIAPLIGLLGTVWGIMRAFHDMSQTGSAAPSVVAAGVAEALLTTAVGLVIAVPAMLLYNYFNRRMNVMLTVAENNSRTLRLACSEHVDTSSSTASRSTAESKRHEQADVEKPVPSVVG
jgi:biopolymer transport protein ExbB